MYSLERSLVLAIALVGGVTACLPEEKSPQAQLFDQAMAYEKGEGVTQDKTQAVALFRKASEQGHAEAQYHLGWAYYYGEGVPQNYAQAVAWTRKAAEQGNPGAQYMLGKMYARGKGVAKDYQQAYAWSSVAAATNGNPFAVGLRDSMAEKLTPGQIMKAQALATRYFEQSRPK